MKPRQSVLVLPAYLALTLVLTWPLAGEFDRSIPAVYGTTDAYMQAFLLGWDHKALVENLPGIFNAPIFYPFPRTLTYMDHMIGEAVVSWPIAALTGSLAAAYNTLVVLSFIFSAWAVYRLLRAMGTSRPGSFLGGFLFAFCPYRFAHLGMLNQIQTEFLPLGLFFLLRFAQTGRFVHVVGALAAVVVQAWFGWYYAFYLGLSYLFFLAWRTAEGNFPWRALPRIKTGAAAALAMLLVLPGAIPYLAHQSAQPAFRRSLGMTVYFSGDLLDYLKLDVNNWAARLLPALGGDAGYWPGMVTLVLALFALRRAAAENDFRSSGMQPPGSHEWMTKLRAWTRRRGVTGFFALLALLSFLMSLGPLLHVGRKLLWVPLPYFAAFFLIPGFKSLRVPGRFAVLVTLSLAILAGMGYDALRRRLAPRRRGLFFASTFAAAVVASWSVPIPLTDLPGRSDMPPAYRWIAAQPGVFGVLDLPMPPTEPQETGEDAKRQFYSLYYAKPRLDGVSGFVPPEVAEFRILMQDFPGPQTIDAARRMGARFLIVHYGDLEPGECARLRAEAAASRQLGMAAEFGEDVIYEILSP